MRGQISTEMIIILAVVLALIVVVATKLQSTTQGAIESVEEKTEEILSIANATKLPGEECESDEECISGVCTGGVCE